MCGGYLIYGEGCWGDVDWWFWELKGQWLLIWGLGDGGSEGSWFGQIWAILGVLGGNSAKTSQSGDIANGDWRKT